MTTPSVFNLPSAGAHPAARPGEGVQRAPAGPHADDQAHPRHKRATAAQLRTAFVPILLMALALCGWFGAQLWDAYHQRQVLQAAHTAQQQTVDNAGKLRQSLDALAADTQRMADAGNANAALLVTELRQRGITISVPGAASTAAPAAAAATR